jgi:hypothetical protein
MAKMARLPIHALLAATACLLGCADGNHADYRSEAAFDAAPATALQKSEGYAAKGAIAGLQAAGEHAGGSKTAITLVSRANLKIIYNAQMELIVKDLTKASDGLKTAVTAADGFIASDELREHSGQTRTGHWRIRVPTERFEMLRAAILALGEPTQNKADSEDVTDQYFDLEGRIKNKKTEQEAIRRYLDDKKITAKLEEIVSVERELSRISGELEQLEGTMRRMQDRTALATIDVTFREIRDYVPPQTPTFGNRVSSAFGNSLADLKVAGENLAVGVAAAAPWLLLGLILLAPALWILRRVWKWILRAHPSAAAIPLADTPRTT